MEDVDKQFSGCLLEQLSFDNALLSLLWCWYIWLSHNGLYHFNAITRLMQTGQKVFVPPGHVSMAFGQPVWLRYELKARDRIFKRNLLIQQDNLFQLKSGNLLAFVVDGLLFQKAKPNLSIKRNFLVSVQNSVLSSENLTETYLPSARLTGTSLTPIFHAEIPKRNFWWARQSPLG